jgi:hypothetical protein
VTSVAGLAFIFRFVQDTYVQEEVFEVDNLSGTTTELNSCSAVVNACSDTEVDILKIFVVTIDGFPSLTAKEAGFVTLFTLACHLL